MQLLSDIITDAGDTFDINREYPEEKFKTLLHLAAERNDVEAARLLVAAGAEVNTVNRLLHTTPLHAAVRKDAVEVIRALLSRKANVNVVTADGKTALHLAAKRTADQPGNAAAASCLQLLLTARDVEVNKRDSHGHTALYVAANTTGGSEYYVSVIKQLVIKGADISIKCDDESIRDVIKARVSKQEFQSILDLFDSAGEGSGPSAASAIINDLMDFINDPITRNDWRPFQVKLDLAPEADLRRDGLTPGELSLLQRAAQLGLHAHVQSILAKGVNPNLTPEGTKPALILAAENGHHQVIEAMRLHKLSNGGDAGVATTDFGAVDRASGSCVLHAVLRRPFSQGASGQRLRLSARDENIDERYERCLDVLLQAHGDARSSMERDLRRVINTVDYEGCTPLHYATQLWPQRVVRKLLEKGANIGMRNVYDEVPIESIQPDTLKAFLDEFCLQSEGDLTNRNLRVTVRYDFLAPPRCDDLEDVRVETSSGGQNGMRKEGWTASAENGLTQRQSFKLESSMSTGDGPEKVPVPETEILWHMRQSPRHRHLLCHPVITSFLWLKWKRISWAYNNNLVFYFAFVAFLTSYVFSIYGGKSLRNHSVLTEQCDADNPEGGNDTHAQFEGPPQDAKVLWHITTILLGFLTVRELAQFLIAPRRYFFSLENWLEMFLVALTSVLLFHGDYGCNVEEKRHIAAIVIVISWSELITVIGRHPKLSTYNIYVTMFYKVSTTFVRFLIW
jgi:ankyrin repeat protein